VNDYLDQVEAQLTRLTEEGAHRRLRARAGAAIAGGGGGPRPPRRRAEFLAFGSALAVVVAVVAIVLINVHSSPSPRPVSASGPASVHTTTTAPSITSSSTSGTVTSPKAAVPGQIGIPIPAHSYPVSFTAISELTWWVLTPAPCTFVGEKAPCGEILRTVDGGRNFIGIQAPHATLTGYPSAPTSGYAQIRFADMQDGFAYGPSLYATHDGGSAWHPVDVGGTVSDLAISAGEAYAVVGTSSGTKLMHSPVGSDDWTALPAAGDVSEGLWVHGSDVLVQSGIAGTESGIGNDLMISHDGGASFTSYPSPSPGLGCEFAETDPAVIWAHCATGMESGVWLSTDGGQSFGSEGGPGSLPNSALFAAASDTVAVVGYQQLYRTADGGATYTPVGPADVTSWSYLGFTDATHGIALGFVGGTAQSDEQLYYTTDGGLTYHLVPLP
jgi:hypothetical protein